MRSSSATLSVLGFSVVLHALVLQSAVHAQGLFPVPLRINMGGPELADSHGNTWLGDPGANQDVLGIRTDVAGGPNAIVDWSSGVIDAASMSAPGIRCRERRRREHLRNDPLGPGGPA